MQIFRTICEKGIRLNEPYAVTITELSDAIATQRPSLNVSSGIVRDYRAASASVFEASEAQHQYLQSVKAVSQFDQHRSWRM